MSHCHDLDPEELLLAQLVRLAICDAQQDKNVRLSEEARLWLWTHAPSVAARSHVPVRVTTGY